MPPARVWVVILVFLCLKSPCHEQDKKHANPLVLFESFSTERLQVSASVIRATILAARQLNHIFVKLFVLRPHFKLTTFAVLHVITIADHNVCRLIGSLNNLTQEKRSGSISHHHELLSEAGTERCHLLVSEIIELQKGSVEALFPQ